ncbi:NADH-quinone oxidoreductase subunit NuoE [Sodalis-like secondary symbiont of Drepanosiphum platanoidis]|uniref:NADH-quinone oxidoreductase subunit NuoE n=1 Tax=Sodalis-like secondary symbiont of Drepanosiphum platanoidis TaxID=2994493 RepID=UPI0034649079
MLKKNNVYNLTNKELISIKKEMKYYETSRSIVVEALKIVQKNRGWISDEIIKSIAKILNISKTDVDSIATFYSQIFRKKVGKYIIRYCDSVVCYINGYINIEKKISKYLNINPGQTSKDKKFTLLPTCCLGNCDKGPSMMINEVTYMYLKPDKIKYILGKYI